MKSNDSILDLSNSLNLDDLVCLYDCVDLQLRRMQLSCCPDTLKKYFNQLNKLLSNIHRVILLKERLDNPPLVKE